MDEGLEPNCPQFAAGEIQAICLSSCEILERAWGETRSISNNNDNTYFHRGEYEGVVFITFPSFYIGDFTAGDSPYEQCDIQNENEVFSACLKGDDNQPALVHKGALAMFLNILRNSDLETQMSTFSKQRREQKIIFVGHSVGGAIATLATIWVLGKRLRQISANCITFGSPLVGDIVLMQSIDRQEWSSNFCHVVSQHDIVPRMVLAPFESIGQHLNSIFPQRGRMMGNDSVNSMHPSTPEVYRKILENVKFLGESSPYKPIGRYMFCSIYDVACIEDPQAVLKMLLLTLQNTEENDIVEENGIAAAFISEHISYGDKLKHVIESGYSTRTPNIVSEFSNEMGIALQFKAMGLQTQIENVREKGARKRPRGDNIEVVNVREKGAHKRPRVDDIEDTMSKEMRSTISNEGGNTNTLSSVNVTLPFIQNTMSKEMSSTISNEGGRRDTATKLEAILTTNAIRLINTGEIVANPILQILSFKRLSIFQDEPNRYKIVLSDGNHMQLAIFLHKSNDLFFSDMLKIQSIVSLTNYDCRATADSRTLIIFSLEVIHRDYQMIGKPKYLYKSQEQQMVEEQTTVSPNKSTKFGVHLPPREHGLPESISPIKDLNPYQSRWTIKGRVTTKTQPRQFNNQRNSGQVFSFDIIDKEDTETRIVCFNDIAELHYDRVHIGAMYTISQGSVKEANKKYNKLNSHLEITLDHTSVLKCCDDEFPVGSVQYNFKKINEIANINNYTLVDIIGVVVSVAEISTTRRSDGSEDLCRTLKLVDISFSSIDVNLWGPICQKEGEHLKSLKTSNRVVVLAIRNGCVAEFKGKVINSTGKVINSTAATILTVEPLIPEAEALHSKFEQEQIDIPSLSLFSIKTNQTTNNMTIASIIKLCTSMTNPLDATIKATVKFIKSDSFCYPACPLLVNGKECKKKCVQSNENTWFCSRCQTSIAECHYKYLLQLKLQDHTGVIWAVAFDEVATNLLHMPARELYMLQYDTQAEATPQGIINAVFFNRFIFTLSIRHDLYNSEARIKTTIRRATKVDFHNECECLLAEISEISTSK